MARSLAGRVVRAPPPIFLAALYAGLIALGTLGLMLPAAQAAPFGWADALFTAVSAVTVTGLAVIATNDMTVFGQAIVLVLFQLGGLGLMAFSVLVLSALGLPIGLTHSQFLREDLNQTSIGQLLRLVRVIFRLVLVFELAGAAMLALAFVPTHGVLRGVWHAVFHSVSAFNNAGMSTLPEGLTPWVADPVVNLAIPALIVVGSIGYGVLWEIGRVRAWRRFSLHAKLMLVGTAALLAGSFVMFAALEWTNPGTLGVLDGVGAKLAASWFQAVSPRSAGFSTVDLAAMEDSTTTMYLALMIIGGGPTSTGGGIKVTTAIVLLLATIAFFRRRTELHAFGRSIGLEEVLKVSALTAISLVLIFAGTFLLTLTHQGEFLDIAFEVTSAFGTVGASRGMTAELDGFGRAVIMALMFVGRVGPLTLGFFLATQARPRVRYPPAQVFIG